ncbi:MAG: lipid-A-disaccharide synthase [Candidatus Eisenbacteria bacterium]|nr:lipid-A-disaccharide synthase [Candidatus Eisenbacteria bacterium]MCC7141246.1 lipid-A-disaccharide synthase [Candidatus Eisenbacteria bacterium]
MKRVFLLAGEASGDLHGALLAQALQARRSDLELIGVGGDAMQAAGVRLILHSQKLAVVGLFEVLSRLPVLLRAIAEVKREISTTKPDLFVPIDFPDFNFRVLPTARRAGVRTIWYISPQVWAWREERVEVLRRLTERVLVIFPFEERFFRDRGVPATWVGHPLVDELAPPAAGHRAQLRHEAGLDAAGPVVALLPGSRRSEVTRIAPLLGSTRAEIDRRRRASGLPPVQWVVGRANHIGPRELAGLDLEGPTPTLSGQDALRAADAALVASGTVTVEAALLGIPTVVVYRTHPLTYAIARRLVRVPHIAMANLVAERRLYPELIQDDATPGAVADVLAPLLEPGPERAALLSGLEEVRRRLGPPGAAERAAAILDEALGPA